MDWATIITAITAVAGGEFVFKMIDRIAFRKEEKKIKKNEAKSSNEDVEEKKINNDNAQIDLGSKFLQQSLEMTEKMKEMMLESDRQRDEYWRKQEHKMEDMQSSINKLAADVSEIKEEQKSEIAFLNGDYKAFKENHKKQATRYTVKKPSTSKKTKKATEKA